MTHPEIAEWLATTEGLKLNPDGRYGLQCVDLVDAYAEALFGVPWPECVGGVNGAIQLLDVAPDAYWHRIDNNPADPNQIPAPGDVLVFGGSQWGHTAVTVSPAVDGVDVLQQDGFAAPHQYVDGAWYSAKPAHRARLSYTNSPGGVLGWLRPKHERIRDTGAAARGYGARPKQCIVDPGDSLSLIAMQYGITLDQLRAANPGVSDLIHPGQVLNLP